jgi:tetratricopeptide (TPR) repeat protein
MFKLAELARKQIDSGDYPAAVATAERWLEADPFSVGAYNALAGAVSRGAKTSKSMADIVRAVLAINPEDSNALFRAATSTSDADVATAFVDKMKPDDCLYGGAVFNVTNKLRAAEKKLAFLDKHEPSYPEPALTLQRVTALSTLARYKDVEALLDTATRAKLLGHLKSSDPAYAADWAANVSEVLRRAGHTEDAREWVMFALERDPENSNARRVLKRLSRRSG